MKRVPLKPVAFGLAVLMLLPAALPAQGRSRMGAEIAVTLRDGGEVWGELIAVKPDSLLVQNRSGLGRTVDLPDIATVRVVKRSKAWQGLLFGFLAGAVTGAVWGRAQSEGDMEGLGAFMGGWLFGSGAGLAGMAAGWAAGVDQVVRFGGLSDGEKALLLARLDRLARERGTYALPAAAQSSARTRLEGPRFDLTWMPGTAFTRDWHARTGTVPFRFLDDLPPGGSGPFDSAWYQVEDTDKDFTAGRLALSYQWTPSLGAEVELFLTKRTADHMGELEFVSPADGLEYFTYFGSREDVSATSLLAGLTFRPVPYATLQPHVVELGLAAGAAWVRTSAADDFYSAARITVDRRAAWTARARASYDFRFLPAAFMGVFAEYRWLEARVPSYAVTQVLPFYENGDYYNTAFTRTTEVTFPARTLQLGGFAAGLRLGFGF